MMRSDIKITSSLSCIHSKNIATIVHKTFDYFEGLDFAVPVKSLIWDTVTFDDKRVGPCPQLSW